MCKLAARPLALGSQLTQSGTFRGRALSAPKFIEFGRGCDLYLRKLSKVGYRPARLGAGGRAVRFSAKVSDGARFDYTEETAMWEQFVAGGWGMWPILFWLIVTVGIIAERVVYLFGSSINTEKFLATMQKLILAGEIDKAVKSCAAANAPLAKIVQAGLIRVNRPDEEVQAGMDEEALREIPKISARTSYLALLANLAMLSGLLGTVTGLIKSFGSVAGEGVDPSQKARVLAHGISEAMNCTAFGLGVAIIGLIGYAILNGKTQKIEDDINQASVSVLNLVVANRQKVKLPS